MPTRPTLTKAASQDLPQRPQLRRFPPLADRSSLGHKLTGLSRQKLAREATAPDPDVWRCLAHFRLHIVSTEWVSRDVSSRISSFEFEDEEDEAEPEPDEEVKVAIAAVAAKQEEVQTTTPQEEKIDSQDEKNETTESKSEETTSQDSADADSDADSEAPEQEPTTPSEASPMPMQLQLNLKTSPSIESGRNDDDDLHRNCLQVENTSPLKHFWSESGQCVPVRIAS